LRFEFSFPFFLLRSDPDAAVFRSAVHGWNGFFAGSFSAFRRLSAIQGAALVDLQLLAYKVPLPWHDKTTRLPTV